MANWQPTTAMRRDERWNHKRLDFDSIPQRLWQLPNARLCYTWKYEWRDVAAESEVIK